jgi:hypothetical protein
MARRNDFDGWCSVCGAQVRALEGMIDSSDPGQPYLILCLEHMPAGALDPPSPPDASKLPSIHLEDDRYER